MSNADNELFELCKEVYKRFPRWKDDNLERIALSMADSESLTEHPLYTSDYLLEKLPFGTSVEKTVLGATAHVERTKEFFFGDGKGRDGNAARVALLKLTIALHEAGELK